MQNDPGPASFQTVVTTIATNRDSSSINPGPDLWFFRPLADPLIRLTHQPGSGLPSPDYRTELCSADSSAPVQIFDSSTPVRTLDFGAPTPVPDPASHQPRSGSGSDLRSGSGETCGTSINPGPDLGDLAGTDLGGASGTARPSAKASRRSRIGASRANRPDAVS